MDAVLQDLRYALRQIRRAPAFAFFIVATLAIGIGANTTIFGVIDALVLNPLPYPHPDRLVQLSGAYAGRGDSWSVSYPNAADWRSMSHSFQDVAWLQGASYTLAGEGRPERVRGSRASWNLFSLLGVKPALGRTYTQAEDAPGAERVVVLGYGLWQRRFGGDAGVIGRSLTLSGNPYTVIGVMPERFSFPNADLDLYVPLRVSESTWRRSNGGLQVIGRLRPGATLPSAQRDMDALSARLEREYPDANRDLSAHLTLLRESMYGGHTARLVLWTLLAAVGLVLLIACVNVANLLLARATTREREVAVRAALGAGGWRVLGQFLTESLVLATLGGAGGLLVSLWGSRVFASAIPADAGVPRDFGVNGGVLAFTIGLTLLTGVLFGALPALHAARPDLAQLIGGRSGQASRSRGRRRGALVVAEVALAAVLLVSAGLVVRSLSALTSRSPGFDTAGILTLRVSAGARYDTPEKIGTYRQRLLERLRAVPGVDAAGGTDFLPLAGTNNFGDFQIEGRSATEPLHAGTIAFTAGYLEAMGIPVLRGRDIDERDTPASPRVVLINRTAARAFFGTENPIGRRLHMSFDGDSMRWRTIAGVIGDVRFLGLDEPPRPEIYLPAVQLPWSNPSTTFVLRTRHDPLALVGPAERTIRGLDPEQAVYDVRTMKRLVHDSDAVLIARILAGALGIFGAIALLLAALGLYGVISYNVAQRTYEIGVRGALGASRGDVLRLVLGQGMTLVGLGLGLGVVGALGATRALHSMLYSVSATDPLTFAATALILAGVAFLATWLPARRAAAIEPVMALRTE